MAASREEEKWMKMNRLRWWTATTTKISIFYADFIGKYVRAVHWAFLSFIMFLLFYIRHTYRTKTKTNSSKRWNMGSVQPLKRQRNENDKVKRFHHHQISSTLLAMLHCIQATITTTIIKWNEMLLLYCVQVVLLLRNYKNSDDIHRQTSGDWWMCLCGAYSTKRCHVT